MLYKEVSLDEPCQVVGCHPLSWHERTHPEIALIEADDEALRLECFDKMLAACEAALKASYPESSLPWDTDKAFSRTRSILSGAICDGKSIKTDDARASGEE